MPEQIKSIKQRVLEILADMTGESTDVLSVDKNLEKHGLDLFERMEFLMELEDALRINVADDDARQLDDQPVREWIQYVEARRAAAGA